MVTGTQRTQDSTDPKIANTGETQSKESTDTRRSFLSLQFFPGSGFDHFPNLKGTSVGPHRSRTRTQRLQESHDPFPYGQSCVPLSLHFLQTPNHFGSFLSIT